MLRSSHRVIHAFIPGKGKGESSRLGWTPGCTTSLAGFGASSFTEGPWTRRHGAEQGSPSPSAPVPR